MCARPTPWAANMGHQSSSHPPRSLPAVWAAFGERGIEGSAAAPERAWPADPRLAALGRRTILPRGSAPQATATYQDCEWQR